MDLGLSDEQRQLVTSFGNLALVAEQVGRIEHSLRFSLGTTIYAGTSEVQRNIIALRRCGLPRP